MTDEKKLNRYVTVGSVTYGPGDDLPADAVEQIRNEKAWLPANAEVQPAEQAVKAKNAGTASGARLATPVTVGGVTYGVDDEIPDEVAAQIRNPKAWQGGELPDTGDAEQPPTGPDGQGEQPPADGGGDADADKQDGEAKATPYARARKAAGTKSA